MADLGKVPTSLLVTSNLKLYESLINSLCSPEETLAEMCLCLFVEPSKRGRHCFTYLPVKEFLATASYD